MFTIPDYPCVPLCASNHECPNLLSDSVTGRGGRGFRHSGHAFVIPAIRVRNSAGRFFLSPLAACGFQRRTGQRSVIVPLESAGYALDNSAEVCRM